MANQHLTAVNQLAIQTNRRVDDDGMIIGGGSGPGGSGGTTNYYFKASPSTPTVSEIPDTNPVKYKCTLKISTNYNGEITCNTAQDVQNITLDPVSTWGTNTTIQFSFNGTNDTGKITLKCSTYSAVFTLKKPSSVEPQGIIIDSPTIYDPEHAESFKIKCKKIFSKRNNLVEIFKAGTDIIYSTDVTNINIIESKLINDLLRKNPGAPATSGIESTKVYWGNKDLDLDGLIWRNGEISLKSSNTSLATGWKGIVHEDRNGTLDLGGTPYYKNDII